MNEVPTEGIQQHGEIDPREVLRDLIDRAEDARAASIRASRDVNVSGQLLNDFRWEHPEAVKQLTDTDYERLWALYLSTGTSSFEMRPFNQLAHDEAEEIRRNKGLTI